MWTEGYSRHGGDVYRNRISTDFSVSINPLGMPAAARKAYREAERDLGQYPDPENRALREALAAHYGLPAEEILCGSGASELLTAVIMAVRPGRAVLLVPSFSGYRYGIRAAETVTGRAVVTEPVFLREEEEFAVTERVTGELEKGAEKADLMILCNPNNPTGRELGAEALQRVLAACSKHGTRLLLDECFAELMAGGEEKSALPCVSRYRELIVVNALTKTYAMPGLRAGWLTSSDRELLRRISRIQPEWPVSVPASAAAAAALSEEGYPEKSREFIEKERAYFSRGLKRLGFRVFPGEANFIFFRSEKEIGEALLARGILIRSWAEEMSGWYYRIAVRRHAENVMLLKTLEELL